MVLPWQCKIYARTVEFWCSCLYGALLHSAERSEHSDVVVSPEFVGQRLLKRSPLKIHSSRFMLFSGLFACFRMQLCMGDMCDGDCQLTFCAERVFCVLGYESNHTANIHLVDGDELRRVYTRCVMYNR
ncbi:hypothetical protein Tco_1122801 [Tanacetum coccineum]|uniref:Uncharacterized protein n=1 Tax=Tanacetum coccineum TaxID=301880 RepID=A0ABQ5B5N4_9ASTR